MLIRSVGHVRANAAFAAAAALAILALDWTPPALANETASLYAGDRPCRRRHLGCYRKLAQRTGRETLAWRARVLTAYVLELALCYGIGQLIGLRVDVGGSHMPMLTAAFYMLALIPVVAIGVAGPKPPQTTSLHLLHAFQVSKVGALACLLTGPGHAPLHSSVIGPTIWRGPGA